LSPALFMLGLRTAVRSLQSDLRRELGEWVLVYLDAVTIVASPEGLVLPSHGLSATSRIMHVDVPDGLRAFPATSRVWFRDSALTLHTGDSFCSEAPSVSRVRASTSATNRRPSNRPPRPATQLARHASRLVTVVSLRQPSGTVCPPHTPHSTPPAHSSMQPAIMPPYNSASTQSCLLTLQRACPGQWLLARSWPCDMGVSVCEALLGIWASQADAIPVLEQRGISFVHGLDHSLQNAVVLPAALAVL